jgi:hypothetical protein
VKTKNTLVTLALLTGLIAFVSASYQSVPASPGSSPKGKNTSALVYHDTWRKLWEDHITWTRMVIVGTFDNLAGNNAYKARLLQNYEDMEDALKPNYGDDAEVLGDLIQDHLLIAVELLDAAKAGNTSAFNDAKARWYQNGEDIAAFMAVLNPQFWKLSEAEPMWTEHLDATLAEAVAHLTNDFAGDVAAYDEVHRLALEMADFFSAGVMRQFHNQFSKSSAFKELTKLTD